MHLKALVEVVDTKWSLSLAVYGAVAGNDLPLSDRPITPASFSTTGSSWATLVGAGVPLSRPAPPGSVFGSGICPTRNVPSRPLGTAI